MFTLLLITQNLCKILQIYGLFKCETHFKEQSVTSYYNLTFFYSVSIIIAILDAFNAVRSVSASSSASPVSFNNINATSQSNFNIASMSLSIPSSSNQSLYWMHIAADVPSSVQAIIKLSDISMTVYSTISVYAVTITMAMSGVIKVMPSTSLNLIASTSTSATYWAAFRIDNLFYPLVAFRVVRTSSITAQGQILFNTVLVNEGNAWNASAHKFIVPYDGIYLLSYSGGIQYMYGPALNLYRNGVQIRSAVGGFAKTAPTGYDTMLRSTVISLVANDVMHLTLSQESNLYCEATYRPISFSGFYYNPISTIQVS